MTDLLVRSVLVVGLVAIGYGGYRLVNAAILTRAAMAGTRLEGFASGKPGILYFTMEDCIPCKTTQRPALEHVADKLGEAVQIIEVDVITQPEIVKSWQVVSVPTTVILDRLGEPRHINHGVTLSGTLMSQLERFCGLVHAE